METSGESSLPVSVRASIRMSVDSVVCAQPWGVYPIRNGQYPFICTTILSNISSTLSIRAQVKFTTDFTGYAPAGNVFAYLSPVKLNCERYISGYIADPSQYVRGMSPLHDSGTGSSLGTLF